MQIAIALDNCVRNVSSIQSELSKLQNFTEQEWLDYKSLITPHVKAEDKINKWYDEGHDIHIIAHKDQYNKKWLKDHYIPYNSIIDETVNINEINIDYWIDCSVYRCFNALPKIFQAFIINENLQEEDIKQKCESLKLPYPLPGKIIFTSWNKVYIYD